MLQTIVTENDLGVRVAGQQGCGGFETLSCHKDGRASGLLDQGRFITDTCNDTVSEHFAAVAGKAAVAARDHAHPDAPGLQVLDQGHHHGRLARPTGDDVANDNHRDRHALHLE